VEEEKQACNLWSCVYPQSFPICILVCSLSYIVMPLFTVYQASVIFLTNTLRLTFLL